MKKLIFGVLILVVILISGCDLMDVQKAPGKTPLTKELPAPDDVGTVPTSALKEYEYTIEPYESLDINATTETDAIVFTAVGRAGENKGFEVTTFPGYRIESDKLAVIMGSGVRSGIDKIYFYDKDGDWQLSASKEITVKVGKLFTRIKYNDPETNGFGGYLVMDSNKGALIRSNEQVGFQLVDIGECTDDAFMDFGYYGYLPEPAEVWVYDGTRLTFYGDTPQDIPVGDKLVINNPAKSSLAGEMSFSFFV